MKITHYSFGSITIDGKTYRSDVIIYPDHVDSSWWRKEGHLLQIEDLKDIVSTNPSILIIGTGYYGSMRVLPKTLEYLKSKGIQTFVEVTKKAVELYNETLSQGNAISALHLTC